VTTQSALQQTITPDGTTPAASAAWAGYRIWLYNKDGSDASVSLQEEIPKPGRSDLMWADVDLDFTGELGPLWEALDIEEIISSLDEAEDRPFLARHDNTIELRVYVVDAGPGSEAMMLHCVVGANWVVTLHQGGLDLVEEFNKPLNGSTRLGELSGPSFLSLVLDWQISGYFNVIDALQEDIDRLDDDLLASHTGEDDLLPKLQELRSRVRDLRRTLTGHREVLGLLSHPRSDAVVGAKGANEYKRLEDRLQQAIESLDAVREMIVGSFDIFMTRTAQATNDIMKRLTLASLLLLPAAVIAGVMGMNFDVALFEWSWMFWVTIGGMAALAAVTLRVARLRGWL
jgi:Mg2+ and Co2+ transporter CorA